MQNRYSLVNDPTKHEKKMAVREEEVVRPPQTSYTHGHGAPAELGHVVRYLTDPTLPYLILRYP